MPASALTFSHCSVAGGFPPRAMHSSSKLCPARTCPSSRPGHSITGGPGGTGEQQSLGGPGQPIHSFQAPQSEPSCFSLRARTIHNPCMPPVPPIPTPCPRAIVHAVPHLHRTFMVNETLIGISKAGLDPSQTSNCPLSELWGVTLGGGGWSSNLSHYLKSGELG